MITNSSEPSKRAPSAVAPDPQAKGASSVSVVHCGPIIQQTRAHTVGGNSSSFAILALMALLPTVSLYWDFGILGVCCNAMASFLSFAADLVADNPPEAALAAFITVWALSSAALLGRSAGHRLRKLRHRSPAVHDLAKRIFRRNNPSRPSLSAPASPGKLPKPGISFQLSPGPRIVLEWVTEHKEEQQPPPSATLASQNVSSSSPPNDLDHSAYWPGLTFLPWQTASQPIIPAEDAGVGLESHGIYTEFTRTLDSDLARSNPHAHLNHSCSMPLLRSERASGPISFECDVLDSTDMDDIAEEEVLNRSLSDSCEDCNCEGVLAALSSLKSTEVDEQVTAAVPPHTFLQFAAMLDDEPQALAALHSKGLSEACRRPDALFGIEDPNCVGKLWEVVVKESRPGAVEYRAERRPLRRGIFMYRTVTTYEDASPREVRRFSTDDVSRLRWDDNCLEHFQLGSSAAEPPNHHQHESCFLYTRTKFPRPMAAREYVFARRVAPRADGGCYIVQAVPPEGQHPKLPTHNGRGVKVVDFTSCMRVRAVPSPSGRSNGAVEIAMIYFEDSQVRPGLMNMAVAKGLWTFVQRQEAAFRCYQCSLRRRSSSLELITAARRQSCGGGAESLGNSNLPPPQQLPPESVGASFLHAPPTRPAVPGDGWEHEDMAEVEYMSVSPMPGSRRARWKRRLFVAAVIVRHVVDMMTN